MLTWTMSHDGSLTSTQIHFNSVTTRNANGLESTLLQLGNNNLRLF